MQDAHDGSCTETFSGGVSGTWILLAVTVCGSKFRVKRKIEKKLPDESK